jgi:UDP-N-acetylmuramoyl-tripeptide--D-alanyl-D-alanine ligase
MTTTYVAREMKARGYRVFEGRETAVMRGAADSREVRPGDLFTAFHGEHHDGNDFVAEALRNGAVAAICDRAPDGGWPDKTIVVTPDGLAAISELAHSWRMACHPRVVGITGTVGKTTAKDLVAATLTNRFRVHKSEGNLNSREGLPLALLTLSPDDEVSVLEMAMDSPGEILELCRVAEPDVGVVLGVGLTHVSKLGSVEAITEEKLSLARYLPETGAAILNADDPRVAPAAAALRCTVLTFGAAPDATIRRGPVTARGLDGTSFDVTVAGETVRVDSPLPGEHVVPAALAAIGVCLALGMTLREAASAVGAAEVEGRLRVRRSDTGATILDDRYNASPASLAGALRMLGAMPGRRIALIGRMAELGDFEAEEHRKAGAIAAENCDVLVAVGESCDLLVESAREAGLAGARWFANKDEAAAAVRAILRDGDVVLVKASRSKAFETLIPLLEGTP